MAAPVNCLVSSLVTTRYFFSERKWLASSLTVWLRLGVAFFFWLVSTVLWLAGRFWPWGWAVGVVLFMFSFPSGPEKKGYLDFSSDAGSAICRSRHRHRCSFDQLSSAATGVPSESVNGRPWPS